MIALVTASSSRAESKSNTQIEPTVAILYFDYTDKNPDLELLRGGLAQMPITDLATLSEIRVLQGTRLKAIVEDDLAKAKGTDLVATRRPSSLRSPLLRCPNRFHPSGPML